MDWWLLKCIMMAINNDEFYAHNRVFFPSMKKTLWFIVKGKMYGMLFNWAPIKPHYGNLMVVWLKQEPLCHLSGKGHLCLFF